MVVELIFFSCRQYKQPFSPHFWESKKQKCRNATLILKCQCCLVQDNPCKEMFCSYTLFTITCTQPESPHGLYLFSEGGRMSQLSLTSGKTKRRFPTLSSIQNRVGLTVSTPSGSHLGGLLLEGDLFVWDKSNDQLTIFVTPLSKMGHGKMDASALKGTHSSYLDKLFAIQIAQVDSMLCDHPMMLRTVASSSKERYNY